MGYFGNARAVRYCSAVLLCLSCGLLAVTLRAQSALLDRRMAQQQNALVEARKARNRAAEAAKLCAIGLLYSKEGRKKEALDAFTSALAVAQSVSDRTDEIVAENGIGLIQRHLGNEQSALGYFDQALAAAMGSQDIDGQAIALSNIGSVYADLGEREKGLDYLGRAMPLCRQARDRECEMDTLNHIGSSYDVLGQKAKSIGFYQQALKLSLTARDSHHAAIFLNNIAWVYQSEGQEHLALLYSTRALPAAERFGDPTLIGDTLHTIGMVAGNLGQTQKQLRFSNRSLAIERQVGDLNGQSYALWNIGDAERKMGKNRIALRDELAALALAREAQDPNITGNIDAKLMLYFRGLRKFDEAIFFGKDAVNSFQEIRRNISGMGEDVQTGFAQSKSSIYRQLAELLVQTDRLSEAEHVLDLLKEEELHEVLRGGGADPKALTGPLDLTTAQQKAQTDLKLQEQAAATLTGLSFEYSTLLAKRPRTSDDSARIKVLDKQIEDGNAEVSDFFEKTFNSDLAQQHSQDEANRKLADESRDVTQLQNTLRELRRQNQRVLGIRLVLGDEHAYALVVTDQGRRKYELKATPQALRDKVMEVRDALRFRHAGDPKIGLAQLYTMVIVPLNEELRRLEQLPDPQARTPTLLWSLDGVLRYLPMSALYDAETKRYLVERFDSTLFTPNSYGHMSSNSDGGSALSALAMGLSRSYRGLPALPGVTPELNAIVHDPDVTGSHGPMEGKLLLDDHFTLNALKSELGSGNSFPVVHIASHFVEETGAGKEPYLMMGGEDAAALDGYALTLKKLSNSNLTFLGTRLLTLSACSTAKGDVTANGMEMDSLGMIAQQMDAEAVLATLWDVNDASTSRLMSDFYARWMKNPAAGKGEALRQAQISLLHEDETDSARTAKSRGINLEEDPDHTVKNTGYAHPYYWAPFVLIGNFE
jgi:CHAT domain-containing protein/tetratricopeptide (TPR) repeat protein